MPSKPLPQFRFTLQIENKTAIADNNDGNIANLQAAYAKLNGCTI